MRVAIVFLSGVLLTGCASVDLAPSGSASTSSKVDVVKPFVPNSNAFALTTALQTAYANSQIQVLRVGNEVKVTYPSDLLFGVGGEQLLPDSQVYVDSLIKSAAAYPGTVVRIDSFTDKSGSAEVNLTHSQERAQSVALYLTNNGIPAGKLSYQGYGSDYPVASNDMAEGRAANRRLVITLKAPVPRPEA